MRQLRKSKLSREEKLAEFESKINDAQETLDALNTAIKDGREVFNALNRAVEKAQFKLTRGKMW